MAVATAETDCPRCGKRTRTIRGRCPNCAYLKDPDNAPPVVAKKVRGGSIWDDLEDLGLVIVWLTPVATLVILGVVLSLDVLLVAAVVVFLGVAGVRALFEWT